MFHIPILFFFVFLFEKTEAFMSDYIVSARKYRPQNFSSVVGQENIVKTLKNSIKNGKLAQAYLFSGPRGVGKTTCARIFAKTINCENITPDFEACNECKSCKAFNSNTSLSISELDAASNNSVDDIRNLIEQVRIPPQIGKYKIYIIDEVHMLSQQAFNAFLKTLEEPPKHAIFILATTEKHKILPTILSRCQVFDFNRIKITDITDHLKEIANKENIKYEEDALTIIAQKADGGLRDALSIFDQISSFSNGNITYKAVIDNLNILDYEYYFDLVYSFIKNDYASALLTFDKILENGFSEANFFNGLASHLRNLLMLKNPKTVKLLEVGSNIKDKYLVQSKDVDVNFIFKALDIINQLLVVLKNTLNRRLLSEMTIIKISNITNVALDNVKVLYPSDKQSVKTSNEETKKENKIVESEKNTQSHNITEEVSSEYTSTKKISIFSNLNIKDQLQVEEKSEKTITPKELEKDEDVFLLTSDAALPDNYFTESEFFNVLKSFFSENGFKSLENSDIKISFLPDYKVKIILHNSALKENLKLNINKVSKYLKTKLKNHKIILQCEVQEIKIEHKKVAQTKEDLYEKFVKKNKNIEELKNCLNLYLK